MDNKTNRPISNIKTVWSVETLLGDTVIVLKKLKECANSGDPQAQFVLAKHYYKNSVKGTQRQRFNSAKNLKKAKRWLKKSAKQGHVEAQHCLDLLNQHHRI